MNGFHGLRGRIALTVAGLLGGAAALGGMGLHTHRSRHLLRDLDAALKANADWIEGLAR